MNSKIQLEANKFEMPLDDHEAMDNLIEVIREVYFEDTETFFNESSENQISLLMYSFLYEQVQNGGFIQLIFNGYTPYIFNSPLSGSLKEWDAHEVGNLLENIADEALELASYLEEKEKTVELLSSLYKEFPLFEAYDQMFYNNDGLSEIRQYIQKNLDDFVTLNK